MLNVLSGVDVVVRSGVQRRLGQHYVYWAWCCRSRSAGLYSSSLIVSFTGWDYRYSFIIIITRKFIVRLLHVEHRCITIVIQSLADVKSQTESEKYVLSRFWRVRNQSHRVPYLLVVCSLLCRRVGIREGTLAELNLNLKIIHNSIWHKFRKYKVWFCCCWVYWTTWSLEPGNKQTKYCTVILFIIFRCRM